MQTMPPRCLRLSSSSMATTLSCGTVAAWSPELDHVDGNPSDDFSRLTETPKLHKETVAQLAKVDGKE